MFAIVKDVKNDFQKVNGFLLAHKGLFTFLFALGVFALLSSSASAEVTLPSTVDVTEYITAGITAMALIVAAALGGNVAFLLVRKAFRWLNKALG